jgi:hypothetical protein
MNRIASRLSIALLATAGIASTALAADQTAQSQQDPDKTQVVPSRGDLQPSDPSLRSMDDNVQRQHDKDRGGNTDSPNVASRNAGATGQAAAGGVRDWSAVDTNSDNLIQPAEMEAALKETGPQAKPSK